MNTRGIAVRRGMQEMIRLQPAHAAWIALVPGTVGVAAAIDHARGADVKGDTIAIGIAGGIASTMWLFGIPRIGARSTAISMASLSAVGGLVGLGIGWNRDEPALSAAAGAQAGIALGGIPVISAVMAYRSDAFASKQRELINRIDATLPAVEELPEVLRLDQTSIADWLRRARLGEPWDIADGARIEAKAQLLRMLVR